MLTRIAVFVSGGGTNLQALIDAQNRGELKSGKIELVLSSSPDAYALSRAKENSIATEIVPKKAYANTEDFDNRLFAVLEEYEIDLIVLAGYMTILSENFTKKYKNRIINVHPSLIPSFCGEGFYGLRVHEAALAYGVKVTGATVHFVNEVPDGGEIIMQKAVSIRECDTPESLQKRVMRTAEWKILPAACEKISAQIKKEKENKKK